MGQNDDNALGSLSTFRAETLSHVFNLFQFGAMINR